MSTGSSNPVGRMICSTTRGVPRFVGSNFSTGSSFPLGFTRSFLKSNITTSRPSGPFSFTDSQFLFSGREFTISKGPGVAET